MQVKAPGKPQAAAAGKLDSVEWRPQASEFCLLRPVSEPSSHLLSHNSTAV